MQLVVLGIVRMAYNAHNPANWQIAPVGQQRKGIAMCKTGILKRIKVLEVVGKNRGYPTFVFPVDGFGQVDEVAEHLFSADFDNGRLQIEELWFGLYC